jgi:hypothetical protein
VPGAKFVKDLNVPAEHARIFKFDWDKWEEHLPSLEALEEARRKGDTEEALAEKDAAEETAA